MDFFLDISFSPQSNIQQIKQKWCEGIFSFIFAFSLLKSTYSGLLRQKEGNRRHDLEQKLYAIVKERRTS
jgi:hypothetical protein